MVKEIITPTYFCHKIVNAVSVTKIITMHFLEYDKNFDIYFEKHNFWEMVYIDSGEADVFIKDEPVHLKRGEVVFIKPNRFHKVCGNKREGFAAFIMSFSTNSSSMKFFAKTKQIYVKTSLRKYIEMIIAEGRNAFLIEKNEPEKTTLQINEHSPIGSMQMIRCYLEQFLIMLLRTNEKEFPNLFSNKEDMENHIVLSVKNMLTYNIYSGITVEEICSSLHYSRTYISKVFKKQTETTVNNYYNSLKIDEAKKLIGQNKYSFTEISEKLHYANPQYFTRVFKKFTQMTPGEYKNILNSDSD